MLQAQVCVAHQLGAADDFTLDELQREPLKADDQGKEEAVRDGFLDGSLI